MRLAVGCSLALALAAAAPAAQPLDDAIAVWHMTGGAGPAEKGKALKAHGAVEMGMLLQGAERDASLRRGGDGAVARFDGGWLDAGAPGLAGQALTIAIRLRDPSGKWNCPLFGKGTGAMAECFNLYSHAGDAGPILTAEIGNDVVAGLHRVEAHLAEIGATNWHDVVLRFDGVMIHARRAWL